MAEYGMNDAVRLTADMEEFSNDNLAQLEQALAAMQRGNVGQKITDRYHEMVDTAATIKQIAYSSTHSLKQMQTVADAYEAAPDAGDKKYVQEEG